MVKIFPNTDAIIEVQVFDAAGQSIPLAQVNYLEISLFTCFKDMAIHYYKNDIDSSGNLCVPSQDLTKLPTGVLKYKYQVNYVDSNFPDGAYDYSDVIQTDCFLVNPLCCEGPQPQYSNEYVTRLWLAKHGLIDASTEAFVTEYELAEAISEIAKLPAYQGTQGYAGTQGEIGAQGYQGTQGEIGTQGYEGPVGPQGPEGTQGLAGEQGTQGSRGTRGSIGTQGEQGTQGEAGPQGVEGPVGPMGTQGYQGTQGEAGPQGVEGPVGPQGPEGTQGLAGEQGTPGIQGTQGEAGAQGDKGPQGDQGPQGDKGPQGDAGTPGLQGVIGTQGLAGEQGEQGPMGTQGYMGTQGFAGAQGEQGPQGDKGPQGDQGPQGEAGTLDTSIFYTKSQVDASLEAIYGVIGEDEEVLAETILGVNGRLDRLDGSVGLLNTKVSGYDTSIGLLDSSVAALDASMNALSIPTKTSDLLNDSGFVNSSTLVSIWMGDQTAYDNLGTYDSSTLYVVK